MVLKISGGVTSRRFKPHALILFGSNLDSEMHLENILLKYISDPFCSLNEFKIIISKTRYEIF